MNIRGSKDFDATEIIANDFDKLKFDDFEAKTLEISTRFHYDPVTGMYLSQYSMQIWTLDIYQLNQ